MDISPKHQAAVDAVTRIPALEARLALLAQPDPEQPERSQIALYGTVKPAPGEPPGADPLAVIPMTAAAGTVDEALFRLHIETPIEGQVTGADPTQGTIPLWARVFDVGGDWWADLSVSVAGAGGDIQIAQTGTENGDPVARLFNGSFARIVSANLQG